MQLYVRIVRSELASKNEMQQLECTHAHCHATNKCLTEHTDCRATNESLTEHTDCHATNKSLTEQAQRTIERDRKRFWQKE